MKLTESRIKEIIREELESAQQSDNTDQKPEDETKTLSALKKFMLEKTKQVGQLKGASTKEVKQIAEIIDLMFGLVGKGEIARFLEYGKQQIQKKTGI